MIRAGKIWRAAGVSINHCHSRRISNIIPCNIELASELVDVARASVSRRYNAPPRHSRTGLPVVAFFSRLWGRDVRHHGEFFDIEGRLRVPPSKQGRPVIFQAGGSPQGRALAGRAAEGVFAAELTKNQAIEHYRLVKGFARDHGRSPDDIKILPGLLLSLGSTEEEARRRSDEIHDAGPASYSINWLSQAIGYDASKLELDEPFPDEVLGPINDTQTFLGSVGFRESIVAQIRKTNPRVREYLKQTRYTGSGHAGFVGTPEQLANHIEDWFHAGAVDGFNLQPDRLIDGLAVIVDELVPILRKRGLYRHEYETQTLREHFQAASPTPPF
ncbi:LLM class flavin-dependent oxidoreductase [Aquamicrobium sp. NLF2-7]|uniref:LLM class flavin-dependent oxidoreductase n=1 Tax=Aquamicrobium sp. NLF2-7 TaxID=2918753 RepID=UPI0023BA629A|nr:LLM class flavin-dependent oxidoreductase [Aquamicrobium sp. NLF2-7]